MKAIMISIKPKHTCNILNGLKTIEIRKKFPKDYIGWVYIYCTKNGTDCYGMPTDLVDYRGCAIYNKFKLMPKGRKLCYEDNQPRLNGKVVARFWCDKVEGTYNFYEEEICSLACISKQEYFDYLGYDEGKAIHITKLEIFDKPMELGEFETRHWNSKNPFERDNVYELSRAPQSWCYVEVDL